jgi:predicted GNAT superfamily acetyltransferase
MAFDDQVIATADAEVRDASDRAGVAIRDMHTPAELAGVEDVFARVWRQSDGSGPLDLGTLVALAHAGNYVAGAYRADELVGASLGFFAVPLGMSLHSHMTAVLPAHAGRGTGRALKLHQRAWCLHRGIHQITWTYDPLVARNAYFNLHRLGASVNEYLTDFYGSLRDELNEGQASDRLLVTWSLVPAPDTTRLDTAGGQDETRHVRRLQIPADIEGMRRESPELARRWREDVRQAFTGLLADGWTATDFDDASSYVFTRG